MDEYILKLRDFSLRWMLLIMIVSILAIMVFFFKSDFNMGIAYGLIYIVATCFFITLVVHSIDRDDVALITSKITMAVCAIGVIIYKEGRCMMADV